MPVENATYVSELNADWPVGKSDFVSEGDDHFRMLKKSIQNTWPNANAPYTGTVEQTNNLTKGINWVDNSATAGAASYFEVTDPTSTDDTKPDAPLVVGTPTVEQYNATPGLAINWSLLTDVIYAVGKYFESETDNRNPADILGFGTWESRAGLLYGAGTVTDKEQVDGDDNALSYEITVGAVSGRLYVDPVNLAAKSVKGTAETAGDHNHGYEEPEYTGLYADGGSMYQVPVPAEVPTANAGNHTHVTDTVLGTQTEPLMLPGYACYRWVRTA